ncbi:MAG: DUF642 domain-containing protein [Burkholderiales bacterium]
MKSGTTLQVLLLTAALAGATSAQANLLTNASFELGTFVNQGNDTMSLAADSTVITGWTVITDTTAWIGAANPFGLSASDGSFFLDLTNYQANAPFAGMSQTIATTPGATYSLSFDLGSSSQWGLPDSITASAAGTSQTFVSPTNGVDVWTNASMQFVASSATTTVLLQGASGINYIGLDNVDVEFVSGPGSGSGSVPEPTTLALLGLGLAGLAASRRRKH